MKNGLFIASFILILFSTACFPGSEQNYEQQTTFAEERISQNEVLKKLDNLCKELPKPADFEYLGKVAGKHSNFVGHKYKTSLNYEQLKQFYDNHFQPNGWQLYEERPNWGAWFGYKKIDVFINVTHFHGMATIDCADKP